MTDKLKWTPEAEKTFTHLKHVLTSSRVLAFPGYREEFIQTVGSKDGHMTYCCSLMETN